MENSWVESYLDALLSFGLSAEHLQPKADHALFSSEDPERQLFSRYYVGQILDLDEESIRTAWARALKRGPPAPGAPVGEKDIRLEQLAWRVWFMKRKKAVADATRPLGLGRASSYQTEDAVFLDPSEEIFSAAPSRQPTPPGSPPVSPSPSRRPTGLALSVQGLEGSHGYRGIRERERDREGRDNLDAVPLPPQAHPHSGHSLHAPSFHGGPGSPGVPHSPHVSQGTTQVPGSPQLPSPDPLHLDTVVPPEYWENKLSGLYIVMISLHGLVRGTELELGRDPDTGGQVKYVVELARALSGQPGVARVDLLTRLIRDPKVSEEYGREEEALAGLGEGEGSGRAYIVRLPCGPTGTYLRKEALWPHVREFADNALVHIRRTLAHMNSAGPAELYLLHGHYADAGLIVSYLSHTLRVPMALTGHSLGRNKLEHLLRSGGTREQAEAAYKIGRRIEAEEASLDAALFVLTSTQEEIDRQWGLYDGFSPSLEAALRTRRYPGRHVPYMLPIPPGLDFGKQKVSVPEQKVSSDPTAMVPAEPPHGITVPAGGDGEPRIWREIAKFLRNPRKPCVLALARPDPKKNLHALVQAFGTCRPLREIANLVLIMGSRTSVEAMAGSSRQVLEGLLRMIDAYDLYGSVAYPKAHKPDEVAEIYRYAYATRGVFVNCALQEPFGLTIIEAASHGVPVVATCHGGPTDILATLDHGVLVEPTDISDLADKCLRLLADRALWESCSQHGLDRIGFYSWKNHCVRFLSLAENLKRLGQKRTTRHRRTLSGGHGPRGWGRARREAFDPGAGVAEVAEESMPGTPAPGGAGQMAMSPAHLPAAIIQALQRHKTPPGLLSLDLDLDLDTDRQGAGPKVKTFTRVVWVALDGMASAPAACKVLRSALTAKRHRRAADAALGVLSNLDLTATREALGSGGVSLADLAFVSCNAGAEIWNVRPPLGAADDDSVPENEVLDVVDPRAVELRADEDWDSMVDFRWDRQVTLRVLQHWSQSHKKGAAAAGGPSAEAAASSNELKVEELPASAAEGGKPPLSGRSASAVPLERKNTGDGLGKGAAGCAMDPHMAAPAPPPPPTDTVVQTRTLLDVRSSGLAMDASQPLVPVGAPGSPGHPFHILLEVHGGPTAPNGASGRPEQQQQPQQQQDHRQRERPGQGQEGKKSPRGQSPRGKSPGHGHGAHAAAAPVTPPPVHLMHSIHRRLRVNGIRATLTLQLGPEKPRGSYAGPVDPSSDAVLHVTPLRASRALVMRHVAEKQGIAMSDVALVLPAVQVKAPPGKQGHGQGSGGGGGGGGAGAQASTWQLSSLVSDTEDLLGGSQKVLLYPVTPTPAAPVVGSGGASSLPQGSGVLFEAPGSEYGPRVTLLRALESEGVRQWVKGVLGATGPGSPGSDRGGGQSQA